MKTIDINCDMGEGAGPSDLAIFPYITSSNISCGLHAGDPVILHNTLKGAITHGVQIGAHPGYPDREGFGRRKMNLPAQDLKALLIYQMAAICGMAKSLGTSVKYVKAHGALYNMAAVDEETAQTLIESVLDIDPDLWIMGLAGSQLQEICSLRNLPFIAEGFADRTYAANGQLLARSSPGAVLTDPKAASEQVLEMVLNGMVKTVEGSTIPLQVDSICIHGDNPKAVDILKHLDSALKEAGVTKKPFNAT